MSEDKEAAILTVNIDNPGLNETPSESREYEHPNTN